MKRRIAAGLAAVVLALSLTACGPRQEEQCVDRNGTQYVCEEDDDDDLGWFPVIIPWSQPHHSTPKPYKPKAPSYKAPSYKAPAYRAPAPAYRAPSYSYRSK